MNMLQNIGQVIFSSFYYMEKFPDLCFSAQIRHIDFPTVIAETLLHALYNTLGKKDMLYIVSLVIFEIISITPAYDPEYHVYHAVASWLPHLSGFLPQYLQRFLQFLAWKVPPFVLQSALTLKRCITVGMMRNLWEAHFKLFGYPDPTALIEKSVVFLFVKFFLGAPPSLVCVFWALVIAHEYRYKFQRKTYEDLLLLPVITLLTVAIVLWIKAFYGLSLAYLLTSYLLFFYWILSRHLLY